MVEHSKGGFRCSGRAVCVLRVAGLIALLLLLAPPSYVVDFWRPPLLLLEVAACGFCLICYFRIVRFDLFGACAIGYFLILMFDAWHGDVSLLSCAKYNLPMVCGLLFSRSVFQGMKTEFLWAIVIVMGAYSFLNLADVAGFLFGYPLVGDGVSFGFTGNRNGFSRYYLAAVCASCLLDYYQGRRLTLRTVLLFALSFMLAFVLPSATSSVALIFFAGAFVLVQCKKSRLLLNAATMGAGYLISFIFIVICRMQSLLAPLITDVLHKNVTFTGRTEIWDTVIGRMANDSLHLLIGFYGNSEQLSPYFPAITTAHNAILDVAYYSGILGLICVTLIFVLTLKVLYTRRMEYPCAILAIFLGASLIVGLMEHLTFVQLWLFLGIGYSYSGLSSMRGDRRMEQDSSDGLKAAYKQI